jgi:hypothetical protein
MLVSNSQPIDDKINWLFLKIGVKQFSFIYKIEDPFTANYRISFNVKLSFMLYEEVKKLIQFNQIYEVLRGTESIGTVKIINILV